MMSGIRVTNSLDTENDIYTKRVRFSEEKTYVVHENFTDYMYGSEKEMCSHQKIFLEVTVNLGYRSLFQELC